jgi:hypothetical protein
MQAGLRTACPAFKYVLTEGYIYLHSGKMARIKLNTLGPDLRHMAAVNAREKPIFF